MLSEKPWRPFDFLLIATPTLGMLFLSVIASVWTKQESPSLIETNHFANFVFTLMFYGIIVLLVQMILMANNITWTEAFGFKSPNGMRDLVLAMGVTALVLPIAWFLNETSARLMIRFHLTPQLQRPVQLLQDSPSPATTLYLALTAMVVAPFVEEVIFRGVMYPFIKRRWRRGTALWVTSIFFSASHVNLPTFVPLVFLGLVLAWLYEKTGNLLAPIFAHSLFNLVNFFWLMVGRA